MVDAAAFAIAMFAKSVHADKIRKSWERDANTFDDIDALLDSIGCTLDDNIRIDDYLTYCQKISYYEGMRDAYDAIARSILNDDFELNSQPKH